VANIAAAAVNNSGVVRVFIAPVYVDEPIERPLNECPSTKNKRLTDSFEYLTKGDKRCKV
jgi:hypothetical protein